MDAKAFIFYSVDMAVRHYLKLIGSDNIADNLLSLSNSVKLSSQLCWKLIKHDYTPTLPEFLRFMAACGFELTLDNWRPVPEGINSELF